MWCSSGIAAAFCSILNSGIVWVAPDAVAGSDTSGGTNQSNNAWPYGPFTTDGRFMVNNQNETVHYAGTNWPGALQAMVPEGLQYANISFILSQLKSIGINSIRLTYAIELIDDIYSHNPNSTLKNSFINALGETNGTAIFEQVISHNPQFNENTTRLDVFDAVADECYKQQIYLHLDNHVSKAVWCCSIVDGNSWFGDTYFNVSNWKRGLTFMAEHARKNWPALTSMSLRNELRPPMPGSPVLSTYGWPTWYTDMTAAAADIHQANPETLIFFSGLGYDSDLTNVTEGLPLGDGLVFNISSFSYANKIVFELHYYGVWNNPDCSQFNLYIEGYNAMDTNSTTTAKNIAPVVLTEFGFNQDNTSYLEPYAQCIKDYLTTLPGGPGGWMQWDVAGSYYIRERTQDSDETYGLFNHDWTAWRAPEAIENFWIPWVNTTTSDGKP